VKKLINISTLSKLLNLVNNNKKKPKNYILRYWEKEFKQIRPKIINKRRYYTNEQVELLKKINFLLKVKGMTIDGARKILSNKINKLDDNDFYGLKTDYKNELKIKSVNLLNKVNKLKKYGKKNTSKS
tara:strand:+ start:12 stop:395 length:384 start_codon:yes stop_codon:yes gene_type:complete